MDDKIKALESLKIKWDEKRREQIRFVFNCNSQVELETIEENKVKLKKLADELNEIGIEYHNEVMNVAKEVAKDYLDNPIINHVIDDIDSDVDSSWDVFHGNREERLRFLAEVIEEFNKLFKPKN